MLIGVFVSFYPQDATGSVDTPLARLKISLPQGCGDFDASLSIFRTARQPHVSIACC
jgi:hypothetical protein